MNYLILVNKNNRLNASYIPEQLIEIENLKKDKPNIKLFLNKKVAKEFKRMQKKALKAGFDIIVDSGYRSFLYQQSLYNDLLKNNKDTSYLALPGSSEHQTGLAIDIAAYQNNQYIDDPKKLFLEYSWLFNNAYKYGFILRYPEEKEIITGYPHEPWHYRYVGKYAKIIKKRDLTLEEFLEVKKSGTSKNHQNGQSRKRNRLLK